MRLTRHVLQLTFSENVFASLSAGDLVVQNLTTGQTLPASAFSLSTTTAAPFVATWVYGGILPDGNYRATLSAGSIADAAGNPLAADHVTSFFFKNGDADRDGSVDLDDFSILATHFNRVGMNFAQGNFNYDPQGKVNLDDFNIFAPRFNTGLGSTGHRIPSFSGQRLVDSLRDDLLA